MAFIAPFPRPFSSRSSSRQHPRRPRVHYLPSVTALAPQPSATAAPVTNPPLSSSPSAAPIQPSDTSIEHESLTLLEWTQITRYVLRHAHTSRGRYLLAPHGALHIARTQQEAEALLDETSEAVLLEAETPLLFSGIQELTPSARRSAKGGILAGTELIQIADTLRAARQIRRRIDAADTLNLQQIVAGMRTWPEVENTIRKVVDDMGEVMENGDRELGQIRKEIRNVMMDIKKSLNGLMAREAQAIQERVVTVRYERFVIPVKAGFKSKFGGVVHDASASGQTLYIEPGSVKGMNDKLQTLKGRERGRVKAVLKKLSEAVKETVPDLKQLDDILARIDAAVARARSGVELNGIRPRFCNETLQLVDAKHPLLVWRGGQVIGADYCLEDGVKCVCITGPNTGGKTVVLKTLGVSVLMAKAGLFVSAKEAQMPWYEKVLADVGDGQDLEQSLSTFSGHVVRLRKILEMVCGKSVVLLDELGGGTDPSEGGALGVGVLRYLKEVAGLTVATTHFGELKGLKYSEEGFENASVEFDEVKLMPTYKVVWGVGGRSHALQIAERLGLGREILKMAKEELGGGGKWDGIEREKMRVARMKEEMEERVREAEGIKEEWMERIESLKREEDELRGKQRREVEEELKKAREDIAGIVRDMQRGGNVQRAMEKLGSIQVEERKISNGGDVGEINVGERIFVGRLGEVDVVEVKGKDLVVAVGGMRAKVKRKEVERKIERRQIKRERKVEVEVGNRVKVRTAANTVDVRGERVDGATAKIDQMMDKAIGMGVLWVIHGHGTGRLRSGVRQFLKEHQLVERIEDASQDDGGTGVTVAHLI